MQPVSPHAFSSEHVSSLPPVPDRAYGVAMESVLASQARELGEEAFSSPVRTTGLVLSSTGNEYVVHAERGRLTARRAVSCLVEPQVGDHVVVEALADGRAFVVSVLERNRKSCVTLSVDGDLRVRPKGRLSLASQEGVAIASGDDVSVVGARVDVNAATAHFGIGATRFVGQVLEAELSRVKAIANTIDSIAERFSSKAKRVFRVVEEIDQLRAGRVDHQAEKLMSLRASELLATAKKLVKVDGKQIHLG